MKHFKLKYGNGEVEFDLPTQEVVDVVEGADYPAIEDIPAALLEALDNPIGTAPLKDIVQHDETVCIVVSDITRAWIRYDAYLPTLLNYLNEAGVPDEKIFLLIAYGAHRLQSEAESRSEFGDEVVNRVRIEHSSGINPDSHFRHIGETSHGVPIEVNELALDADLLILTGGIVYHLIAGFGGGRKAILPGISSYQTIQKNHNLCLSEEIGGGTKPEIVSGNITNNIMHDDQMQHGRAVEADFLINSVANTEGKLAKFVAGHWEDAWLEGTKLVKQIYGVPVNELADCVIASAGGYPKDINLYQGVKTQVNAVLACKPGGVVILLMELPDIHEPEEFLGWFDTRDLKEREIKLRNGFTVPGFIAFHLGEDFQKYRHILVTKPENKAICDRVGIDVVTSIDEAIELANKLIGRDDYTVTVMPLASNTVPLLNK